MPHEGSWGWAERWGRPSHRDTMPMCPKGMLAPLLAVPRGLRGFVCSPPAVFNEYLKISGKPIERSIKGELSGDFEKLMLAVGTSARGGRCAVVGLCWAVGRGAGVPPLTLPVSPAVKCIRSTAEYFAERLYKAMKVGASSQPQESSPRHAVHGTCVSWGLCSSSFRPGAEGKSDSTPNPSPLPKPPSRQD